MPEPLPIEPEVQPLLSAAHVEDVFAATEEIRASDYPNVPAELLLSVLAAERDNPDNRAAAARAVAHEIDAYLLNATDCQSEPGAKASQGDATA